MTKCFGTCSLCVLNIRFQDAFLAGQHFAKHYPASMNRVDELRRESNESNKDNTVVDTNSTNSTNDISDNNLSVESVSRNENNQLQRQIAEEKAAAKIFPLNLISNRFKSKDPNILKGKSSLYS